MVVSLKRDPPVPTPRHSNPPYGTSKKGPRNFGKPYRKLIGHAGPCTVPNRLVKIDICLRSCHIMIAV